jgi:hypothetical protein
MIILFAEWFFIIIVTLFYGIKAGTEAYILMKKYQVNKSVFQTGTLIPQEAVLIPSKEAVLIPSKEAEWNPQDTKVPCHNYTTTAFIVFNFTAMTFFCLCAFYSPWRIGLLKAGDDAKKKYEATKKESDMYQDQIKSFWIDTLNKENRYFFITFMLLSLLPFFYFLFFICTNEVPQIETFLNQTFSFILLLISVFYTALVLLVYTICHEKIYMIIPFLMFFFFGGMIYFQRSIPFMTTIGFLVLCMIEAILVLKRVAFAWCLIPLVPFFLTLFILYAQ